MRLLFAERANRDAAYKDLRRKGIKAFRSSTGPQQIHSIYVEDRKAYVSEADKGFGNTIYKTYFPNLYVLESE